jgi:hypothetical protein
LIFIYFVKRVIGDWSLINILFSFVSKKEVRRGYRGGGDHVTTPVKDTF